MDKEIGKITKGEYQGTVTDIVVGVREYNGRVGIDIREYVTSDRYTGPTKKGLRIPAESFPKFKEMINSISENDLKVSNEDSSSPSQENNGDSENEKSIDKNPKKPGQEELPDY